MTEKIEQLVEEYNRLDEEIATAAVAEDATEWIRLRMRKDALPSMIAEAKARPIRKEVQRLEEELERLESERQAALAAPLPQVPAAQRGTVTGLMRRNQELSGITSRTSMVGKELDERRRQLAQIEHEGPKDPALFAGR